MTGATVQIPPEQRSFTVHGFPSLHVLPSQSGSSQSTARSPSLSSPSAHAASGDSQVPTPTQAGSAQSAAPEQSLSAPSPQTSWAATFTSARWSSQSAPPPPLARNP